MASKTRTVTVATPTREYPTADEMDVELHAFSDSVYIKWPDFGRVDRKIAKMIKKDVWDVETAAEAAEYCSYLTDAGVPEKRFTSDYCLHKKTVMQYGATHELSSDAECDMEYLLDAAEYFVNRGVVPCNRTKELFEIPKWGTPTGSYVATVSAEQKDKCPNCGAPKSDNWECVRSSRRTRVPNTYKCTECGHTKKGITTG